MFGYAPSAQVPVSGKILKLSLKMNFTRQITGFFDHQ